ncbi:hypothetical protein [Streptomyces cinereoruber]|uniref:hypothetical protein n=1 Tax=Streptomyces cinereoruber TaxID=67260 RepID=UPI003398EE7A
MPNQPRLLDACTALEAELLQAPNLNRAMDVYDALIITRRLLPCTCTRTGYHAKDCRRYVPGHELASPVLRVQRAREELTATTTAA